MIIRIGLACIIFALCGSVSFAQSSQENRHAAYSRADLPAPFDSLINGSPTNFRSVFDHPEASQVLGPYGARPMHVAAVVYRGDEALTGLMLQGASINVHDNFGRTPVHYAALAGRSVLFEYMKWRGSDMDLADSFGLTPLAYSAFASDTAGIAILAKLTSPSNNEWNQALFALAGKSVEELERMIELVAGRNFDTTKWRQRQTDDRAAALTGLLKYAKINAVDSTTGMTALHFAASSGDGAVVRLLLEHKADRKARDLTGRTPYDLAAEQGRREVMTLLQDPY